VPRSEAHLNLNYQGQTMEDRINWSDQDWAKYLNCPVEKIPEYRKALSANIVMEVHFCNANERYEFRIFKKVIGSKGRKIKSPVLLDWVHAHHDKAQVVRCANEMISSLELKDEVAKKFNVPAKSVQMMLIRER